MEEAIKDIFDSHFNDSLFVTTNVLSCFEAFDFKVLYTALSYVWNDVFLLYGWIRLSNATYQSRDGRTIVEVHNNWTTLNSKMKRTTFEFLHEVKRRFYPRCEVVFGCIADKQPRKLTLYNKGGGDIIVLTGDWFLDFMLGRDSRKVERYLLKLLKEFCDERLKPFMRSLC